VKVEKVGMEAISIIIPNWNGRRWLGMCLDSLRAQTREAAEIILVDDGSTDDSVAFVRENYPEVRIVELAQNRGFCAAANAGLRAATQAAMLLLNNDARLEPHCLEILESALEQYPTTDFFALCILDASGQHIDSAGVTITRDGRFVPRDFGIAFSTHDSETHDPETVITRPVFGNSGGAGLYRRALFDDVGLFDKTLQMYLEDVDLNLRARLRGHECRYLPNAIAYHMGSTSLGAQSRRVAKLLIRNHLLVLAKSLPAGLWVYNFARLLGVQIRSAIFYAKQGRALLFLGASSAALLKTPALVGKRARIQAQRKISNNDLTRLLEP
jgi:GT2 family glycosyltransferase